MKRFSYSFVFYAVLFAALPFALLCALFVRGYLAFGEAFDRRHH